MPQVQIKVGTIACDHGLIWRGNPSGILAAYDRWSRQETGNKAVIIYDTMWHSTETMAKAVCHGLLREGLSVKMMSLKHNHRSDVMTELLDAKAVIIGSPTLNNGMLPAVADFLTYMKGFRLKNRIGAAFGSYGWSGEAVKQINQALTDAKIELVDEGVRARYVPDHDALRPCLELGSKVGKAVKESG